MSNGQVSESHEPPHKCRSIEIPVIANQPDKLIHSLPGQDESSQLGATERRNGTDLASHLNRPKHTSILARDSLPLHNARLFSRTCPSPYYFGGGMPSLDYMTNSKAYYSSYRQDAFTPGRESISSSGTSVSSIVTFFGKFESLGKTCFVFPKDSKNDDAPPKPVKRIQSKSKQFSKSLAGAHLRVSRFLWLPVRKRFGLKNSESEMRNEIIDPNEQLHRKVGAQRLYWQCGNSSDFQLIKQSPEIRVEESDARFTWAEKWRPERLSDFICNKPQAKDLDNLVRQRKCPHMIFEGPPGVGKTSLIRAMIGGIFEGEDEPVRKGALTIQLKGEVGSKIVVPLVGNPNYTEISLNSLGGYERNVIDRLVSARFKTNSYESIVDYKVIVIREADKLSTDTQYYIRWLMERHKESCKLIFCCSNASKLEPISPLCKIIHVEPPTIEQTIQVLQRIAKKEHINLPEDFAKRIAESSDKNLRQAIRSLEACKKSQYPFAENQKILTGWEGVIAKIAKSIVDEQSPKQLYNIRAKLQKLIMHNLNPNFVFSTLVEELKQHLDANMQRELLSLYKLYNGNMDNDEDPSTENRRVGYVLDSKRNANHYIRIEEFTARFMSIYKAVMISKNQNHSDA